MTGIGVWHVGVDVLIAYRWRCDHAVVLCWRRGRLFRVAARRILTLRNGFFPCTLCRRKRDGECGTIADNRQDQSQDDRCADAAQKHLLSPTVLSLEKPRLGRMVPDWVREHFRANSLPGTILLLL